MYLCSSPCAAATVAAIQEKQRKKKKIKAIKSRNRLVTKEIEVSAVQQTWKKFVTKVSDNVVLPFSCISVLALYCSTARYVSC